MDDETLTFERDQTIVLEAPGRARIKIAVRRYGSKAPAFGFHLLPPECATQGQFFGSMRVPSGDSAVWGTFSHMYARRRTRVSWGQRGLYDRS
jgi:hypothetical protein